MPLAISASLPFSTLRGGVENIEEIPTTVTEVYLAKRPENEVTEETFAVRQVQLPSERDIPAGHVIVQVLWVSADPAMRTWISPMKNNYVPPVQINAKMRSFGVGRTLTSTPSLKAGQIVTGMLGWCSAGVYNAKLLKVSPELPSQVSPSALLSAIGHTGLTAYFGLLRVGAARSLDTVLVSAAAGATGGVAVQIAKHVLGCRRVVGIAGGEAKCKYVRDVLGADECVDYKAPAFMKRLAAACPDGVDVYFDNVGGTTLEAALRLLRLGGRVVVCGAISTYNQKVKSGPRNYLVLITKRARMEGFIVSDYANQFDNALKDLAKWVAQRKITVREDVVQGIENAPTALVRLFNGKNIGKVVIKVQHHKLPRRSKL